MSLIDFSRLDRDALLLWHVIAIAISKHSYNNIAFYQIFSFYAVFKIRWLLLIES